MAYSGPAYAGTGSKLMLNEEGALQAIEEAISWLDRTIVGLNERLAPALKPELSEVESIERGSRFEESEMRRTDERLRDQIRRLEKLIGRIDL